MLREARIILPCDTGLPKDAEAHDYLANGLLANFGGFTCKNAEGAWMDPGSGMVVWDNVKVYDVAVQPIIGGNTDANNVLRDIAFAAGTMLEQTCVYVRFYNGVVELVDTLLERNKAAFGDKLGGLTPTPPYATPGTKRLPQVGEVWSTPSGSLAAVVSQATILDGGYNCVVLTKGSTTAMPGRSFVVDLDGNWLGSKEPISGQHPLALARFVRRFDHDTEAAFAE